MVKLTGPGLGKAASGNLGGAVIFSTSKGRAYLKKLTKPKQPRTEGQVAMRAMLAFLSAQWSGLAPNQQATWQDLARAENISPFNAFQSQNLTRWARKLPPTKAWPAAETSTPATLPVIDAAGGVRHVELDAYLIAVVNDNWTLHLFYSTAGDPTPGVHNLIHIFQVEDFAHHNWTHSPLAPGTHYYKVVPTSDDGNVDWGVSNPAQAVVT